MHHLIASYLFQNKSCPLPGLGTLSITSGKATSDFLNTAIDAPVPAIVFETKEHDAGNLLDYIAAKTNTAVLEVINKLGDFCNRLKSAATANRPATLDGVGDFYADASGALQFKANAFPTAFLPPVKAERVIHPQAEHTMLVGDKETTNTVMTEYYSDDVPVKKARWWIWAIVVGVLALLAILFYLNNNAALSSMAGSAMPIE